MEIVTVRVENPNELNFILGQSHFIKTVDDVHEALVAAVPGIKFGLAFCEASGPCLVRTTGTDPALMKLAETNALAIGAGHSFILFLGNAYPINLLRVLRQVPEMVNFYCATANAVDVLIGQTDLGRGILGVVDGHSPKGVETAADVKQRREFLCKIGYRVG
jgi:uncharacterized protein